MQREEIKRSIHQACGHSTFLQRGLFTVMDWLTGQSWHVRREIKKWMRSAPEMAHILDAGTGYGHHAYWLSQQNTKHSILAVDVSTEHVCRGNAYVRDAKLSNLLFKTLELEALEAVQAFDLVLCTDTIGSIHDQDEVIERLHRSLRDDALLIATVRRRPPDVPQGRPSYGYEMDELKQLFRKHSFHKVKAHFYEGHAGQLGRNIGVRFPLALLRFSRLFAVLMPFYFILAVPVVMGLNWVDSHTAQASGRGILLLARK